MTGWWLVSYLLLWLTLAVAVFLNIAILRQLGLLWVRTGGALGALTTAEGPEIGDPIPVSQIVDGRGVAISLVPTPGRMKLLLFMSPTCQVCDPMIPTIPAFAKSVRREADLVVLLTSKDGKGKFGGWSASAPPVATEPALQDLFALPTLPYAVAVSDSAQIISKGLVNDVIQLESLLNEGSRLLREARASNPTLQAQQSAREAVLR